MPAVETSVETIAAPGASLTLVAADATNGHLVEMSGETTMVVHNGGGSSTVMTIAAAVTINGVALSASKQFTIAAGEIAVIPLYRNIYDAGGANAGKASVTFSVETSVKFGLIKINR